VNHSKTAKKELAKHVIYQLAKEDSEKLAAVRKEAAGSGGGVLPYLLAFAVLVGALVYQFVLKK